MFHDSLTLILTTPRGVPRATQTYLVRFVEFDAYGQTLHDDDSRASAIAYPSFHDAMMAARQHEGTADVLIDVNGTVRELARYDYGTRVRTAF